MSKPVIKIEDVSKMYRLGELGTGTLYRDLHRSWARLRGKSDPFAKVGVANDREQKGGEYVWALKDINLEVQEGEILGIIGRNGAGKSTLLKLLSRVTAPTTGRIQARGRIASLLEVGTGFHPELTGRENIYLNGAILGMRRWEIANRLEEIVEFSGCAKYIDTPVKRYSSGMMVRLGFSVAAHLECEILIVDEVLAVGDAEFQKKCLGKMKDISQGKGRTIIFVSHNMGAIGSLCNRGIIITKGSIEFQSENIHELVSSYLRVPDSENTSIWRNEDGKYRHPCFTPIKCWLLKVSDNSLVNGLIRNNENIAINVEFEVDQIDESLEVTYGVYSSLGDLIYISQSTDTKQEDWPLIKKGRNHFQTIIPIHFLNEGDYRIELNVSLYKKEWIIKSEKSDINIYFAIFGGLSNSPYWLSGRRGLTAPLLAWKAI